MNAAAMGVLKELPDVVLAYGISDEYRSASSPKNLATMHHGLISLVALSSIDLLNYSIDGRGNMSEHPFYHELRWANACYQQNPNNRGIHIHVVLCPSMALVLPRSGSVISNALL